MSEEQNEENIQSFIDSKVLQLVKQGKSVAEIMKQTSGPLHQLFLVEEYGKWEPGKLQEMQEITEKFEADFTQWATDTYGSVGAYYQEKADAHGPVGDI